MRASCSRNATSPSNEDSYAERAFTSASRLPAFAVVLSSPVLIMLVETDSVRIVERHPVHQISIDNELAFIERRTAARLLSAFRGERPVLTARRQPAEILIRLQGEADDLVDTAGADPRAGLLMILRKETSSFGFVNRYRRAKASFTSSCLVELSSHHFVGILYV